ncbi:MAG: biotin/lipoyl-binding protein, partial [Syntrophomonas sp.]|nr:biotin/lipoyl-binding protein [Syntrophomonas sp.]
MSKRTFSAGLVLVLLMQFLFLSGCEKVKTTSTNSNLVFNGLEVKKGQLQNDALVSGKIEAGQMANVVSKVSGKVGQVNVDVGSKVKKGQVLLNLEANDLEVNIDATQAAADTARINYDLALKQHQRGQSLLSSYAISQADYENNFQGVYLKAEAGLRLAQSNLEKAQIA